MTKGGVRSMSPTRRHAAFGLLAAGGALSPAAQAFAQVPAAIELPDEDHPPTALDTRRDRYEHMLAPVQINDQGPFHFLLDTGANVSCVSHALMERLDLKSVE